MTRTALLRGCAVIGAATLGTVAGAALQRAPTTALAALGQIERGEWQLRAQDASKTVRSICLGDPAALLQIAHPGATCSRFVIDNQPRQATVHYTCPGAGHGQTTIKIETPRLFHLDSQGIAANQPFALSYEARRTGECAEPAGSAAR